VWHVLGGCVGGSESCRVDGPPDHDRVNGQGRDGGDGGGGGNGGGDDADAGAGDAELGRRKGEGEGGHQDDEGPEERHSAIGQ
jgi:hypothetical protein